MRYKSKPRFTEAEQFFRNNVSLLSDIRGVCQCPAGDMRGHVHTIHNNQVVNLEDGDYVLPEPNGVNFYPVKPDIFEKNWEPE
jgi:hypothetical protein